MNKWQVLTLIWAIVALYCWCFMSRAIIGAYFRNNVLRYGIDGVHWLPPYWVTLKWYLPGGEEKQIAHLKKVVEQTLDSGDIFRNGGYCNFFTTLRAKLLPTTKDLGFEIFNFDELRHNNNYREIGGMVIFPTKEFWLAGWIVPLFWPISFLVGIITVIPGMLSGLFDNIIAFLEITKELFTKNKKR